MVPVGSSKLSYLQREGKKKVEFILHSYQYTVKASQKSIYLNDYKLLIQKPIFRFLSLYFSLTFCACRGLTTPMGLDKSLKTAGSSRFRMGEV